MMRIIDWNISYQNSIATKLELLERIIAEVNSSCHFVVALQEVTEKDQIAISRSGLFNKHVYSLHYRKPGSLESNNRRLGCLIGVSHGLKISGSSLIDRALFPERALCAKIMAGQKEFEVISFHSLTGVSFKIGKSSQFAVLAEHLNANRGNPIILCCDLNEPKVDHIDSGEIKCFSQAGDKDKYADYILKPNGIHELEDAYRLWLNQNETEHIKVKAKQYNCDDLEYVPLSVSHVLKGGKEKRYDYIMVTPHFEVSNMEYRYEDAVAHGSDHVVLVADVKWDEQLTAI